MATVTTNVSVSDVLNIFETAAQVGQFFLPLIQGIITDWSASTKTEADAAAADAKAAGQFSAMAAALSNVKADDAAENAKIDQLVKAKFEAGK